MKYCVILASGLLTFNLVANAQQSNPYKLKLHNQTNYRLKNTVSNAQMGKAAGQQPLSQELRDKPHASEIEAAARANNLSPALVHALIHVESRHNANAISNKGAIGLMQVMPGTAQRFGINDPTSTQANLNAGTRYLRNLLDHFDQRLDLALAAYNAGEGAVMRYNNQIPPYRETQHYVPAVLEKYDEWQQTSNKSIFYLPGTQLDSKAVARFKTETTSETSDISEAETAAAESPR